jgi:hypothetical protein
MCDLNLRLQGSLGGAWEAYRKSWPTQPQFILQGQRLVSLGFIE